MPARTFRFRYFFLLFLLGCSGYLSGQNQARVVYPVKQNNLWGFMSKGGDLLVPPRYDAIGEQLKFSNPAADPEQGRRNSGFRLVELNGKLGIVDRNLQEVLSCDNDYILPISATQFLVKRAEGYAVLDSTGRNLSGRYYAKLEYAGATRDGTYYYTIFDKGRRGLINARGDTLLACAYEEIKTLDWQAAPFLTRVRSDRGWWRLTAPGGETLLREVAEAKAPHPGVLLVTVSDILPNQYLALDARARPIPALTEMIFMAGTYLSPDLVLLRRHHEEVDEQTRHLFQVRKGRLILPQFPDFRYLDGRFCVASSTRTTSVYRGTTQLETLLTGTGEVVDTSRWFLRITDWPGTTAAYRVRGRTGWGLIDTAAREILREQYSTIDPLRDGLAQTTARARRGMITATGRVVAAARYTDINRRENVLSLEIGNTTTKLYLDDDFREVSLRQYRNLRTLTVAPPNFYRIAEREDFSRLRANDRNAAPTPTPARPTNAAQLVLGDAVKMNITPDPTDPLSGAPDTSRYTPWLYRDTSAVDDPYRPRPAAIAKGLDADFLAGHTTPFLGPRYFLRFYRKEAVAPAPYLQNLVFGDDITIYPQSLFADGAGKLVTAELLGLRIFDFKDGWEYAPALRTDGRFLLLGKNGEPLRDQEGNVVELTFVGNSKNGLLRVCVGGRLDKRGEEEVPKHPLTNLYSLLESFFPRLEKGTLVNSIDEMVIRSSPTDSARWGVLNTRGEWVVPPEYDFIAENINGQMIAYRDDHYGVLNAEGETVVPFEYKRIINYNGYWRINSEKIGEVYFNWRGHQILDVDTDSVGLFREGYAPRRADGRWAYVDQQGRLLNEAEYLVAQPFGEGLAAAKPDSLTWVLLDTAGRVRHRLAASEYHDLSYFADRRCRFERNGRFGYLKPDLQALPLAGPFRRASDFDRGRAVVVTDAGLAVIDTSGNYVIPPGTYVNFTPWNAAGVTVATLKNNRKQLIGLDGKPLHAATYAQIIATDGPFFPFKEDRYWGYLNEKGEPVIPAKFMVALPFAEGRARVQTQRSGGRWVFIGQNGRPINEKAYGRAGDFSGGRAFVQQSDGAGLLLLPDGSERAVPGCPNMFVDGEYIGCNPRGVGGKKAYFADESGGPLFLGSYERIEPFGAEEMTFVKNHGRWGIIDRRGMQLVACKYYMYAGRPDGIFKVGPPAFGIYDTEGKLIVPAEYDNLELMEKGLFRVERGGKVGYLNTEGKVVWPLQN